MARPRSNNITLTVALRGDPKFFDIVCEKAIKYDGSVAAYVMRVLKEHEIMQVIKEHEIGLKSEKGDLLINNLTRLC